MYDFVGFRRHVGLEKLIQMALTQQHGKGMAPSVSDRKHEQQTEGIERED